MLGFLGLWAASSITELVILDARNLPAGPLATLRLPFHIPIGEGIFAKPDRTA